MSLRTPRGSRKRRAAAAILAPLMVYLSAAYVIAPEAWWLRDRGRVLPDALLTATPAGIPGEPVNLALVGAREDVLRAMHAAGWDPADAVTLRTSVEIGLSVLLDRSYADAPVSALLYDGRRQDLAFEKPVGVSADQRHHVRFWLVDTSDLWLGAASFDRGVGISHDTGQITHHIGPDLDAERDLVAADLKRAGWLGEASLAPGSGITEGRNGGGDPYFTDGKILIGTLAQP